MKIKTALLCAAAVFLGGAGIVVAVQAPVSQQNQVLPDPNDVDRVDQIAESLGTTRSYNRDTLLMNPEPDGLVFRKWMDRKKATVERKLPITMLAAPNNITTVSTAIKWERAARDGDETDLAHYYIDLEQARGLCPQRGDREDNWFNQERMAHTRGERTVLIDWKAASAKFKAECRAEAGVQTSQRENQRKLDQAADEQLAATIEACRQPWREAEAAYQASFSRETGMAAAAAATLMNQCVQEAQRNMNS